LDRSVTGGRRSYPPKQGDKQSKKTCKKREKVPRRGKAKEKVEIARVLENVRRSMLTAGGKVGKTTRRKTSARPRSR